MPFYAFSNPDDDDETIEVLQSMNEDHVYELNGVKWNRVFSAPHAFVKDSPINPDSARDFMRVTEGKKDSFGDIWDRSKELSEKRKEKYGHDPVAAKNDAKWSKERGGRKIPKNKKDLVIKV